MQIICLGGGVGTSTLLSGLKQLTSHLSVVTSMADDGGSSGRLRKAYHVMPPGDIISCIAALMPEADEELKALLLYRFPGSNKANKAIDGHKLGNLIMLAEMQRTGDFYKAIEATKRMFGVSGEFFPATDERVRLSAITPDGRRIHSETTLDLALYAKPYGIKKIYLTPRKPKVNPAMIQAIREADVIISGPGDLYTNQLPVLVVPQIRQAIMESKAKKVFVLNIANKPFETKDFTLQDFVQAFADHVGEFPFDTVIANNNQKVSIPTHFHYSYISLGTSAEQKSYPFELVQTDLVNAKFPLYHDPIKLAETLKKTI